MTRSSFKFGRSLAMVFNAQAEIRVDMASAGHTVFVMADLRALASFVLLMNHGLETKKAGFNPAFF
jgi:hypothetical protein